MSGIIALLICVAIAVGSLGYTAWHQGAAYEFEVWFPSKKQRKLYLARNETRKDWLEIMKAIETAERMHMDEAIIKRLEGAKENARAILDIDEENIKREKARIADSTKFQRLLDKWGDEY